MSDGVALRTFHILCKHLSVFYLSLAIGLCSVEPTKRETGRVRLYPMESIRQHSTSFVKTSVYFSKSLAIGLPLSLTDTKRDGSCLMESIRQNFTPQSVYFCKSLAIGLPVSPSVVYPRRSDSVRLYWTCMTNKTSGLFIYFIGLRSILN